MGEVPDLYIILFAVIAGATLSYLITAFSSEWKVLGDNSTSEKYPSDVTCKIKGIEISGFKIMAIGATFSVLLIAVFAWEILQFQDGSRWEIYKNTIFVVLFASAPYAMYHFTGWIVVKFYSGEAINEQIKLGRDIEITVFYAFVYVAYFVLKILKKF
jgi:hypothetical protein